MDNFWYILIFGTSALVLHKVIVIKSFLYEPRLIFIGSNCLFAAKLISPHTQSTVLPIILIACAVLSILVSYGYYLIKERHSWVLHSLFTAAVLSTYAFFRLI